MIVLAPDDSTLLLQCRHPTTGSTWWITPGGGVDAGESHETTARREMREEVGWSIEGPLGPCVWTREHVFEWGANYWRQQESYYVLRVPSVFVPTPQLDAARLAREGLVAFRWWRPSDLAAPHGETFAPRRFPDLLASLLRNGPPPMSIDAGV